MKLLFLTGSRGEWGYIRPILKLCQQRDIEFKLCVTNMHLLPAYGLSANEIEADGFTVDEPIFMSLEGGNHYSQSKSLGVCLMSFTDLLYRDKPNWIVLAGDRGEQLMGAIAGSYTYTPVAHIQAGELSGNIDGLARHAIGKFTHLHFASNQDAADRLLRLGEEPHRVKLVGAPQLDELEQGLYSSVKDLNAQYDLDFEQPFMMVVQHPVTEEYDQARSQIEATIQAIDKFDMTSIWIMPNNDAGSDMIRREILAGRLSKTHIFQNLKREDYLGMLKNSVCMVGNSSSGLLEAPTFEKPAVNIGRRQAQRVRGKNVIDVPEFEVGKIVSAIERALSSGFQNSLRGMTNPYGDGRSSERILELLENTPHDSNLLIKQLTY